MLEVEQKYLIVITKFLKITGMYAIDTKNLALKSLIFFINAICLLSALIILLQFFLNMYFGDKNDFVDYVPDILNIGIYLGCGTRLIFGVLRKDMIRDLIEHINVLLVYKFESGLKRFSMEKFAKWSDRIAFSWEIFVFVSVQSVIFYPLIFAKDRRIVPLPAWTPWNHTISPVYEITYFYHSFVSLILTTVDITITAFTISCAILAAGQYDLLSFALENAFNTAKRKFADNHVAIEHITNARQTACDKSFMRILKNEYVRCIRIHENLLICVKKFENLFAPINMVILLFDLFFIIFLTYTLVHTGGNVTYISYLLAAFLEAFTINYCGQIITTKSEKLRDKLYNTPWYVYDKSIKSLFHIMQMRINEPIKLTAGKCVTLCHRTFLDIIRTSYSIYTVLSKMTLKN